MTSPRRALIALLNSECCVCAPQIRVRRIQATNVVVEFSARLQCGHKKREDAVARLTLFNRNHTSRVVYIYSIWLLCLCRTPSQTSGHNLFANRRTHQITLSWWVPRPLVALPSAQFRPDTSIVSPYPALLSARKSTYSHINNAPSPQQQQQQQSPCP